MKNLPLEVRLCSRIDSASFVVHQYFDKAGFALMQTVLGLRLQNSIYSIQMGFSMSHELWTEKDGLTADVKKIVLSDKHGLLSFTEYKDGALLLLKQNGWEQWEV